MTTPPAPKTTRIAVVGSRDYPDLEAVRQFVREQERTTVIISGGARGVDDAAVAEARRLRMAYEVYPADWTRHGRRAGMIRNAEMVERADAVVAFWDGESRGTKATIEMAKHAGKLQEVFQPVRF
jgi:predicted Rossmann-fold nucleotide-binding protein